jgi:hypothetical protein
MKSYYVPEFPISKITMTGEDGWVRIPNHPRMRYGYLDAVLEHIDNSKRIDPIQIIIHDEKQVHAGPSGVARLYALTKMRGYANIPCIVNSKQIYDWFGPYKEITSVEEFLGYFDPEYLPKSYSLDENGAFWSNHRPYASDVVKSMRVSDETKNKLIKMIEEEYDT